MSCFRFPASVASGLVLFLSAFFLEAQPVSSSNPSLSVTSGMIGVSSTQTARLNVLNLEPVIPGVTPVACPATLEFYDDTGALLKQESVSNIPPATAANLVFKPTVASTAVNARAQLRAVVVTPSVSTTPTPVSSGSTSVMPVAPACTLLSSYEVMDDATGDTQSVTTDFRPMPGLLVVVVPPPISPAVK
jgi:hypothetical protein